MEHIENVIEPLSIVILPSLHALTYADYAADYAENIHLFPNGKSAVFFQHVSDSRRGEHGDNLARCAFGILHQVYKHVITDILSRYCPGLTRKL